MGMNLDGDRFEKGAEKRHGPSAATSLGRQETGEKTGHEVGPAPRGHMTIGDLQPRILKHPTTGLVHYRP